MTMDIFPTVARLAGASTPQGHLLDGLDFLPVLQNQPGVGDRELHWLFGETWAVRQGPWKLIGRGENVLSLVNLDDDPSESRNALGEQPERRDRMLRLHRKWMEAVGNR
jgi:arylsulfatase A-like enzyme